MTKSKSIDKVTLPDTSMVMHGSWGANAVGRHVSTMELYVHEGQAGSGSIEWDIPSLERTESIGLTWDNDKNLLDYDGISSLPREAIALLEKHGFKIDEAFRPRQRETQYISVQHFARDGKYSHSSSLGVYPDALKVVGVLPHQTRIRLDRDNLLMLRCWIDEQLRSSPDTTAVTGA